MKSYEIYMRVRNHRSGYEASQTFYFKPVKGTDEYVLYDEDGEIQFRHDLLCGEEPTPDEAEAIAYFACQNRFAFHEHPYIRPVESYCKEI